MSRRRRDGHGCAKAGPKKSKCFGEPSRGTPWPISVVAETGGRHNAGCVQRRPMPSGGLSVRPRTGAAEVSLAHLKLLGI